MAAGRVTGAGARPGQVRGVRFVVAPSRMRWLSVRHRLHLLLGRSFAYLMLLNISFVFLFPVLYLLVTSAQTVEDFVDPTVYWIPTKIQWDNYVLAFKGLFYPQALLNSTVVSGLSAVGQVLSASLAGYGFARGRLPGRDVLFMLAMLTFLIPPQTIIVPLFMLYKTLGWIDTYAPFIVPSFFAHGLRGALFIFVFRQFFRGQPWELEEAARIDGAGALRTYLQIMLPLARPAVLVVFLFSLVWHWNDFFEPSVYLYNQARFTLPLRLNIFYTGLQIVTGAQAGELYNEPLLMAASLLVIIGPLLIYLVAQRYFVQSIERTGLVE